MNPRHTTLAIGVMLLAGLVAPAFAQSSGTHMKATQLTDTTFMRHAAADGLAEVQLGRIALDKSSSAQVKQLAQRIVDDHTKANDQLMTIAQRKQVTLPTEPMPAQKQEAQRLQSLSGSAFDQAYAHAMVRDHRKAIKLFGMESQKSSDSDLKPFASTTLPVLKTHLQMAEQIAGSSGHHMHGRHSASSTPMDSNGSMSMPPSGSTTH